jgi:hypothetical protein
MEQVWTGTENLTLENISYFTFLLTPLFCPLHNEHPYEAGNNIFKTNLASLHISRLESHKNVFLLPEPSASSSPFFIWTRPFYVELAQQHGDEFAHFHQGNVFASTRAGSVSKLILLS